MQPCLIIFLILIDEEVTDSPAASAVSTPNSTLPRSLRDRELPQRPDDDSGGSFSSNHSAGGSLPRRPKPSKLE